MKRFKVNHMQETLKRKNMDSQWPIVGNGDESGVIESDKPFEPGDYVSISTTHGPLSGRVLTKGRKTTKLESIWGNSILIKNSTISRVNIIHRPAKEKYFRASVNVTVEKHRVTETLEKLEEVGKEFDKDGTPQLQVKEILDSAITLELSVLVQVYENKDKILSQIYTCYLNLSNAAMSENPEKALISSESYS